MMANYILYTVNHKKRATLFLIITMAILGRNWKEYSTNELIKFTTSP